MWAENFIISSRPALGNLVWTAFPRLLRHMVCRIIYYDSEIEHPRFEYLVPTHIKMNNDNVS